MTEYARLERVKIEAGNLSHPKYRPDIDGLRAIAILSVVFFHAFPSKLSGGFIGVDIFFVISGFLISTIIFGSLDNDTFSFSTFYARRIKRIFPALLIVITFCIGFGWFALYPDEYKQLGKHVAGGSTFISNFLLYEESGYFDTSAEVKPLLHLWSLGIEEQFYIVWPALVWLVWRLRLNVLTVTIAALGTSFLWNVFNISTNSASVFYMPHTRVWELLIGTFLAYIVLYGKLGSSALLKVDKIASRVVFSDIRENSGDTVKNIFSICGVALLSYGFYKITSETVFPGWWAVIPSMGAALIIAAGQKAWINRSILSNKLFVWVGLISFPLYLWHWPLLSFARIIEGDTPSREIRIAAVLAAVLLAWGTYAFVEKPLKKVSSGFKTAVLIAIMGVMGVIGYTVYANDGLQERPIAKSSAAFNSQFSGPLWKFTNNEACLNRYPMAQASSYGWWFCMTNKDEAPTVLLLGNSFANHLYPGLISVDSLKGNTTLSIGTCGIDMLTVNNPLAVADTSPCSGNRPYEQRLLINKIIEDNKTLKYAVIDGLAFEQNAESIARVEEVVALLKNNNVKPIIFIPHVLFFANRDLKGCYSRPFKSAPTSCELESNARTKINKGFAPLLVSLARTNPDVPIFDQNEIFCSSEKCSPILNGMPIYRDIYSHYTEYASVEVAKHFAKWAEEHAPDILVK
ncbi:acyltransferase family protein [Aeromonas veronii]|uniref:acyltransferase family protein n=1 Tax=Aeromonas veronii TaxID=654 RepID=UPI003006D543